MKVSKILLVGFASIALSVTAVASELKDKMFSVDFVQQAKVVQSSVSLEPATDFIDVTPLVDQVTGFNGVTIADYGGELYVEADKIASVDSELYVYIANVTKMQNQNFERMSVNL